MSLFADDYRFAALRRVASRDPPNRDRVRVRDRSFDPRRTRLSAAKDEGARESSRREPPSERGVDSRRKGGGKKKRNPLKCPTTDNIVCYTIIRARAPAGYDLVSHKE